MTCPYDFSSTCPNTCPYRKGTRSGCITRESRGKARDTGGAFKMENILVRRGGATRTRLRKKRQGL
jgi:hypothetical protein